MIYLFTFCHEGKKFPDEILFSDVLFPADRTFFPPTTFYRITRMARDHGLVIVHRLRLHLKVHVKTSLTTGTTSWLTSIMWVLIGLLGIALAVDWSEHTYVSKYGAVLHQPRVQDTRHVFFTINFIIHRENGGVKYLRQKLLVQFYCTLYNHGVSTSYIACSLQWLKNRYRKDLSVFST